MPKLEAGRVIQFGRLPRDGIDDFLATVSGVDAPQARRAVQYPLAVRGGVIHALGLGQQTWVLLELTVCREGPPQIGLIGSGGWYVIGQLDARVCRRVLLLRGSVIVFTCRA